MEISDELRVKDGIKAEVLSMLDFIPFSLVSHRLRFFQDQTESTLIVGSATCDKWKSSDGTPGHPFCSCPKLNNFCDDIFHLYSDLYSRQLTPPGSLSVVFGCPNYSLTRPPALQQGLMFGIWSWQKGLP